MQRTFYVCIVALALSHYQSFGQEKAVSSQVIRSTLAAQAQDYRLTLDDGTLLQLNDRSLLNWNNPQRTTEVGIVNVWTDAGMPMAIASLFTYEYMSVRLKHEFISLSEKPITARYNNTPAWAPSKPGLVWKTLPNQITSASSSKVPDSKVRRLVQMRRIASAFSFEVTSREGEVSKLRLLTQPLLRFESKKHDTIDGAIFAFSISTDPEVLLILRATDQNQWRYAIVRSTNLKLTGSVRDDAFWSASAIPELDNSRIGQSPFIGMEYTSFHPTADLQFHPK